MFENGKGGRLQPNKLPIYKTGVMGETIPSVLAGKHLHEKNPTRSMLEAYNKTPIFIPVGIKEDVVESVMQKISGSSGLGG